MNTIVGALNSASGAWVGWMLHMSWQVALLVALVWLVSRATKYQSARLRHLLWLAVFIKLVVPPMLATPWSAGNLLAHAPEWVAPGMSLIPTKIDLNDEDSALQPSPSFSVSPAQSPTAKSFAVPPATSQNKSIESRVPDATEAPQLRLSAMSWTMLGWASISLVLVIAIGIQFRRYVRAILKNATLAPQSLQNLVQAQQAALGVRGEILTMASEAVHTPAVFGIRRPIILLPLDWADSFSSDELSSILAHEVAHIKRGDLLISAAAGVLTCLYWFHPAVWLASLYQRREREMASDDLVLASRNEAGKAYASTLLRVAERFTGRVPAFAGFLGLLELSDNLLHRVLSATDSKRPRRLGWKSTAVLIAVLLVLPMAPWYASAQKDSTADDSTTQAVDKEIAAHYTKANPEVQEYIRWTTRQFGRSGLWLPENAFDALTPEQKEQKVTYYAEALKGEYGRHLCEALASAGVLKDKRLLPGVLKAATYHRDDSDYDCRPKWIAVEAAGRFDDEFAVPSLIPLVDHGNQNTRMWARASLARLTGQNFNDDKQAWAKWWNDSGKEPKIDLSQLKPWTPPVQAKTTPQSETVPTAPPVVGKAVVPSESRAVVDSLPGELVFKALYQHRSRGADYPTPSTMWLKRSAEIGFIAAAYMPSMNATYVAYINKASGGVFKFDVYSHGRDGRGPFKQFMKIAPGKVEVTYEGGEKNGQTETYTVPGNGLFQPNSRPDPYIVHMALAFQSLPFKDVELACYDWDNTGKGMASYNTRVEYKGKESVTVPAGTFEAHHYVETQTTSGDTWYKKRAGSITEYWALDNGLAVRILRHREPYEVLLASIEKPANLPGQLNKPAQAATTPPQPLAEPSPSASNELAGTLHGTVRNDATGQPVAGAYVAIDHTGDAGGSNLERFHNEGLYVNAETDANGAFTLEKLALRSDHPFYVTAPGFVRDSRTIALTSDKSDQTIEVRMKPGATIVTQVLDDKGAPLDGVTLRLAAKDGREFFPPREDWPSFPHRTEIADKGSYTFKELAAGQYRLQAINVSSNQIVYIGDADVDLAQSESKTVQIKQSPSDSSVTLTIDPDPNQLANFPPQFMLCPAYDVPLQLGTFIGPESRVYGEIIAYALVYEPNCYVHLCDSASRWPRDSRIRHIVDFAQPIQLQGFPPGKYTAVFISAGMYPNIKTKLNGGIYPRWMTFEIREHAKAAVQLPWTEPRGTLLETPQKPNGLGSLSDSAPPTPSANTTLQQKDSAAPNIVSITPAVGAHDVDSALKEIRVTFDQDMAAGFSWTGGGEAFPKTTGKPAWIDKRTCVLPVSLEAGKVYRLGINSTSYHNFCGVNGIPARNRAVYFATKGANVEELAKLEAPKVVSMSPDNGAAHVAPNTVTLTVTFDKPMGGGFSWVKFDDHYPATTGKPAWNAEQTACTMPVHLIPNSSYHIGLNSGDFVAFTSALGIPLEPVEWRFTTSE